MQQQSLWKNQKFVSAFYKIKVCLLVLRVYPNWLSYLGALDNPLTPFSVAKFLRICPGLPKEAAGSFLGEAGKEKFEHEWDDPQFHKDVLHYYVRSFELSNQVHLREIATPPSPINSFEREF